MKAITLNTSKVIEPLVAPLFCNGCFVQTLIWCS